MGQIAMSVVFRFTKERPAAERTSKKCDPRPTLIANRISRFLLVIFVGKVTLK